jgi:DNA-binding XRE family transcriptional regulator
MNRLKVKNTVDLQSNLSIKGFNQVLFSKEIGVTSPYLSMILRGKRNPSPILAKKIADKLGVEVEDIFFIEEYRKS